MYPPVVVVADLLVDGLDEFADVREPSYVPELQLEVRVKGLLVTVLPRAAFSAVRRLRTNACEQGFVGAGDVLAALVGVEIFRACTGSPHGVFKRIHDECGRVMIGHMPANDFPCVHVDDGGEIPESINEPEIGEVPGPDHVGGDGTNDLQDVRDLCFWPSEVVELHEAESSSDPWLEAVLAHDALCFLAVHAERPADAPGSVGRMFDHHRHDLVFVFLVERRLLRFVV